MTLIKYTECSIRSTSGNYSFIFQKHSPVLMVSGVPFALSRVIDVLHEWVKPLLLGRGIGLESVAAETFWGPRCIIFRIF